MHEGRKRPGRWLPLGSGSELPGADPPG